MKNSLKLTFLLLCTFSLLFTWNTQAQTQSSAIHVTSLEEVHDHNHTPGRNCHAHTNLQNQIQADPSLEQRMQQIESMTQQYIREHRGSYGRNTINIPVYVHVLYRTSQENISDAQIQSQMDQLNADFAATNSDIGKIPTMFASVAAGNTGIQFTLVATTRKSTTKTSWGTRDDMKKSSRGGIDPITPETHLNMWVCNIGGGILGYAQFPGGSLATDGVVMGPQYFGSTQYGNGFYLSAPYDEGRTTTHEVGHYLNLRHIWGDGGCTASDFVDDTPDAGGANTGCPAANSSSCGSVDMHMNYMDYSYDACMYMFSAGQKDRMIACLAQGGPREVMGGNGGGGGGGNNCYTTVELTLTTKKKTAGISWTVEEANTGNVVASNGTIAPRSTTTTTLNLPAGDYVLNINTCCGASYSLSGDGQAVSGTSFCIGSSARGAATTTTIVEEVAEQNVQLYPNPANSTINVDLGDITTNYTGRIVDATGRTVWVGELEAGANAINISALSTGLYYVAVVKADGKVITKKFVKE
ncbi:MAG: M43 family zinc metalloprotease [Aureispira sp.]